MCNYGGNIGDRMMAIQSTILDCEYASAFEGRQKIVDCLRDVQALGDDPETPPEAYTVVSGIIGELVDVFDATLDQLSDDSGRLANYKNTRGGL